MNESVMDSLLSARKAQEGCLLGGWVAQCIHTVLAFV